jgi:fused signal recognition particle receptor
MLWKKITAIVTNRKLDQDTLDALEEGLITSDLGPVVAAQLVEELAKGRFGKDIAEEELKSILAAQIEKILQKSGGVGIDTLAVGDAPRVVVMVGVNGSGKTTSIAKLARHFTARGKKLVLGAGDTFRAAAVEQLGEWAKRTGADFMSRETGADSAAVAFDTVDRAKRDHADMAIIDTAGRVHNRQDLMQELEKIIRVIKKADPTAPHAVILTLDATIGQNAIAQVEAFHAAVPLTGLVVTKLDGSARAGVVVALAARFGIPILAIGTGEGENDLQPFDPIEFSRSLVFEK